MHPGCRSALGSSTQFIQADVSSKGNIHFKGEEGEKPAGGLYRGGE